jgi:hypothetical protein
LNSFIKNYVRYTRRVKLNPVFPKQNNIQHDQDSYHQQIEIKIKIKEEIIEVQHVERSILLCSNVNTPTRKSQMQGQF